MARCARGSSSLLGSRLELHRSEGRAQVSSGRAQVELGHPGVLVAKVGYFGVKSAKVLRPPGRSPQIDGTKPAKVGRLGPRCAKVRRGLHTAPTGASAKRSSIHAASKVAKVGAAGGPKLLKWGRLRARRGSNLLKSDRRRRLTKRSLLHKKRASLRGRTKVAKVGPLRARVKSAKVRPTPYV